jgi:hypothetical protein
MKNTLITILLSILFLSVSSMGTPTPMGTPTALEENLRYKATKVSPKVIYLHKCLDFMGKPEHNPCKDGLLHGIQEEYYPDGVSIKARRYYVNGVKQGVHLTYHKNGVISSRALYKYNTSLSYMTYDIHGQVYHTSKIGRFVRYYYYSGGIKLEFLEGIGDTSKVYNPLGELMGTAKVIKDKHGNITEGIATCIDGRKVPYLEHCIGEKSILEEDGEGMGR